MAMMWVIIRGVKCKVNRVKGISKVEAEKHLNRVCTLCTACGQPIFPGSLVTDKPKRRYHYAHLREVCGGFSGAQACGRWGKGRLILPKSFHM